MELTDDQSAGRERWDRARTVAAQVLQDVEVQHPNWRSTVPMVPPHVVRSVATWLLWGQNTETLDMVDPARVPAEVPPWVNAQERDDLEPLLGSDQEDWDPLRLAVVQLRNAGGR